MTCLSFKLFLSTLLFSGLCFVHSQLLWLSGHIVLFYFNLVWFDLLKAEMKRFATSDTSVLKLHYEKKVQELEHEKKSLQVCFVSGILMLCP